MRGLLRFKNTPQYAQYVLQKPEPLKSWDSSMNGATIVFHWIVQRHHQFDSPERCSGGRWPAENSNNLFARAIPKAAALPRRIFCYLLCSFIYFIYFIYLLIYLLLTTAQPCTAVPRFNNEWNLTMNMLLLTPSQPPRDTSASHQVRQNSAAKTGRSNLHQVGSEQPWISTNASTPRLLEDPISERKICMATRQDCPATNVRVIIYVREPHRERKKAQVDYQTTTRLSSWIRYRRWRGRMIVSGALQRPNGRVTMWVMARKAKSMYVHPITSEQSPLITCKDDPQGNCWSSFSKTQSMEYLL